MGNTDVSDYIGSVCDFVPLRKIPGVRFNVSGRGTCYIPDTDFLEREEPQLPAV